MKSDNSININSENKWKDQNAFIPFPHNEEVNWYALNDIINIEKGADVFTLTFSVGENIYKLYLSFTDVGGIRLYSDKVGFHNAKSNKQLFYCEEENGIKVSADCDTEVFINHGSDIWSIEILEKGKAVHCIQGGQILIGYREDGSLAKVKLNGNISENEIFTGLGQRFDSIIRNGTESLLWNLDSGFQVHDGNDIERKYSYTNIPLLHSTNGYTLFINSSYAIDADIGKTDSKKYFFECYGSTFDLYYWTGEFSERLESYARLTGYNILPPKWAFSYWAGNSAIYFANANGKDHIQTLKTMMQGYAEIGTPIKSMFVEGVIHRDEKVYEYLSKTNTRVLAWHDSAYPLKHKPEEMSIEDSPHLRSYFGDRNEELQQKYCDFTHPNAMAVIDSMHGKYIKLGIKGAMIDFADAVPYDSITYDGRTGDEMHNLYAYIYQKQFKELYEKYNGKDFFLFARAGFPGTQSFMAKFLGDEPCSFNGLRASLTSALNLSLSGFSLWGCDIGGLGVWRKHIPSEDCYRRWMQWATFNPIMRSHGHTTRAPWDFSADAVRDFQKYYWLRENFMDSIYSSVIDSSRSAAVMTEPMQLAFPNDESVALVEDEYMFCKDILVAPVLTEKALAREVILPVGDWINFWTGLKVAGGVKFKVTASEGTIPLFLRFGTVLKIKLSENLKLCENMESGSYNALLITPANRKREVIFNNNETDTEKFISYCNNGNTVITNSYNSDIKAIIAKGILAEKVVVDDVNLSKVAKVCASSDSSYVVDEIRNVTTICLPDSWKKIEITDSGKIVKNLAFKKFIYSKIDLSGSFHRTIADGWAFNYWTIPRSNADFILDLEEVKDITEIQMTWGIDYADSYMVEVSEDGENWSVALKVINGTGDEEILKMPPDTKAKYVRFMNFSFPQRTPAILGDIRVYGTEFEEK